MQLIGQYDSPFVRRVAITLTHLNIAFDHNPLSVFSTFDAFAAINPVVKAPSLITDDGTVLMDSTLILDYVDHLIPAEARLAPTEDKAFARAQRCIGLALAACEKTVQIVYEHALRPHEKLHQPWLDRVQGQLHAAYELLDKEAETAAPWLFGSQMGQADITAAVAIRFTREMLKDDVSPQDTPHLAALSARAEETAAFLACPFAS